MFGTVPVGPYLPLRVPFEAVPSLVGGEVVRVGSAVRVLRPSGWSWCGVAYRMYSIGQHYRQRTTLPPNPQGLGSIRSLPPGGA